MSEEVYGRTRRLPSTWTDTIRVTPPGTLSPQAVRDDGPGDYVVVVQPRAVSTDVLFDTWSQEVVATLGLGPVRVDVRAGVRAIGQMLHFAAESIEVHMTGVPQSDALVSIYSPRSLPHWEANYSVAPDVNAAAGPFPIPPFAYALRFIRNPASTTSNLDYLDGTGAVISLALVDAAMENRTETPIPTAAVQWRINTSAVSEVPHGVTFLCGVPGAGGCF